MATTTKPLFTKYSQLLSLAIASAVAVGAGGVNAQAGTGDSPQPVAGGTSPGAASGPQVRRAGDVSYVTGGIGERGEARTTELGRDMNLQLVFARAPTGSYVADASVSITDSSGNVVLELASSDPLLFATLPPGTYRVRATADGRSIERSVSVPEHGQHTEYFHWSDATPAPGLAPTR